MSTPPTITLRTCQPDDAAAVSQLVLASFDAAVANDWSPAACEVFHGEMAMEPMTVVLEEAVFALVAEADGELVGVLVMGEPAQMTMLFVRPDRLRTGIGRALWAEAQRWLDAQRPSLATIELNASLFAVPFYRAMGFYPISPIYENEGACAVRMACWLPSLYLIQCGKTRDLNT
jgi:GNAT superfamily N-acetyltransferase